MSNKKNVTIFGKTYPMYQKADGSYVENSVFAADLLPYLFASQAKHFSPQEYYQAMIAKYPQFKRKWYVGKSLPTEKDIEQYFIKDAEDYPIEGATSVPFAEKKLGIKIAGGYKYPNNMSSLEYRIYLLAKRGLRVPGMVKTKEDAYMHVWQELHYPQDKLAVIQALARELIQLNPKLKVLQFDKNDIEQVSNLIAGVSYDFPVADIQLYLNGVRSREHHESQVAQLRAINVNPDDIHWIMSSDTIRDIATKLNSRDVSRLDLSVADENGNCTVARNAGSYKKATERVKNNAAKKLLFLGRLKSFFKE